MDDIKILRERMFHALAGIQEANVVQAKINIDKGVNIDEVLNELTYDVICEIMVMIDGYLSDDIQIDLVERGTNRSLREGVELHDTCPKYIMFK